MGASELLEARDESQREDIWSVRRQISIRIREASVINVSEDVSVPIGCIADQHHSSKRASKSFLIPILY
jgi:glycolate oxidase